jgi:hypothetical protein
MLMVRQCLFAMGFTLAATTIWGFLESYELVDHVPAWLTFIIFCAALLPGALISRFRR